MPDAGTGGAATAAARAAIRPSFQNNRWICQEPSPRHNRTIGTANTVGQNCGRNPVIAGSAAQQSGGTPSR